MGDFDFLDGLKDTSAYKLARMAGCDVVPGREGPAAEILGEIRDAVVEAWEAGKFEWDSAREDHEQVKDECAEEGIIPYGFHEVAVLFVDLGAYREANEHTMEGHWSGTIDEIMRDAIDQIRQRAAVAFINEARKDFDLGFVCDECGDSGKPHVCYPGECNGSDGAREDYAIRREADKHAAAILTGPVTLTDDIAAQVPQVTAEGAEGASVTQAFMRNMEAINAEEFGTPMPVARRVALYGLGALAVLGVISVLMVVLG